MTRALVTGASGFIGGHLTDELLRRGVEVRCLVRGTSQVERLQRDGVELVRGDLSDSESIRRAISGCDQVFHLAALTAALDRRQLMEVNAAGAARIALQCARCPNPPVLVLASSIAASGPTIRGRVRRESDTPHPISNYGQSKRAGEIATAKSARHVPVTVVRPGIVFGARNREMLPMFQSIDDYGLHAVAGYTSPPLSLIHVDDVVEIMLLAAKQGKRLTASNSVNDACHDLTNVNHHEFDSQGYYFATTNEFPDYATLGRMLSEALGLKKPWIVNLSLPLSWIVAAVSETMGQIRRQPYALNLDKMREALAPSWACSPQRTAEELGFTPPRSLRERLRDTVDWYREHGWLRPG
jgi:nucleoside-diphosphate-sugar epimerase